MWLASGRIALLAEGVEDLEFYVPMMRLQEECADVVAVGIDLCPVHGKNGIEIARTATIANMLTHGIVMECSSK